MRKRVACVSSWRSVSFSTATIFGELVLDCLHRTENAMTQEHAFKAAELCLIAQRDAVRIE